MRLLRPPSAPIVMSTKTYWDSSAVVKAVEEPSARRRLKESHAVTRLHTLAECFSTLTGSRLAYWYAPKDAAKLLAEIVADFEFVDLTLAEILEGLKKAQAKAVRGGRVHDWLHAVAARKAGCTILVTLNTSDFTGLEEGFKLAAT